jgi:mannose-6-phosphate isomerase-like protein (cupin superfamily)
MTPAHPESNVERWDPADGPLSEAALRARLSARGYRCTLYLYPPGTCFGEHAHEVDKIDAVLSGRFRIVMDGRSFLLGPGDMLAVPRGRLHRAEVVGESPVVSVDAVRAD